MSIKKNAGAADALVSSLMEELNNPSEDVETAKKKKIASEPTAVLPLELEAEQVTSGRSESNSSSEPVNDGHTVVMGNRQNRPEPQAKTTFGIQRSAQMGQWSSEAQLAQADSLRVAQTRIQELEKEVEQLRDENDALATAAEFARSQSEELQQKNLHLERVRSEQAQAHLAESNLLKDSMRELEKTKIRLKNRIEEMQLRLNSDLKRVRVRERELENRLELARLEKTALLKSKDENILDLKSRNESIGMDLQTAHRKIQDLQMEINSYQDQLARTMRALKLALTNLEAGERTDLTLPPLKKAE